MFSSSEPQIGSLLISEPFMLDENFIRSVILIFQHSNDEGTLGLILNRSSNELLGLAVRNEQSMDFIIHNGGPIEQDTLWYLHRANDRLANSKLIYKDIYFGGDFEELRYLINEEIIIFNEIKFFKGYTSWAPGQLKEEIQQNSWAVDNNFFSDLPFIYDQDNMWKEALINLGPQYAHVANFPKSSEIMQN